MRNLEAKGFTIHLRATEVDWIPSRSERWRARAPGGPNERFAIPGENHASGLLPPIVVAGIRESASQQTIPDVPDERPVLGRQPT